MSEKSTQKEVEHIFMKSQKIKGKPINLGVRQSKRREIMMADKNNRDNMKSRISDVQKYPANLWKKEPKTKIKMCLSDNFISFYQLLSFLHLSQAKVLSQCGSSFHFPLSF
jgi:hypothetical protein